MLTKPMLHQTEGLARLEGRWEYGLFCEQGTGKTWILMADAERAFGRGRINGLLVVAPKGVHSNWTRREIPTHMSAPTKVAAWRTGSAPAMRACAALSVDKGDKLKIMSINVDALNFKAGFTAAATFLRDHRAMMVVDESHRIKTPKTGVTKAALRLGPMAIARRIASGTPITNAPPDIWSQFEFLKPGLSGTSSYRAFVARFAELMPDDTGIMRHIRSRMMEKGEWARIAAQKGTLQLPQVYVRDRNGHPKWRNLDQLSALIAPHTYRVLKRDCLDLPEKIYQTRYFNLSATQQRAYDTLKKDLVLEVGDDLLSVSALSARTKLQQITSGFVLLEGVAHYIAEENPRLELLEEVIQDQFSQFIIWAHFLEEIDAIMKLLKRLEITAVEYHGDVTATNREIAVDGFQSGEFRVFVGQPQSGGVGITLTAAQSVIYYSNDYNWGTRAQSEDRAHRKGTVGNVLFIDLAAEDTIDEAIASALQRKEEVAARILGDDEARTFDAEMIAAIRSEL